jgi:putative transposase
MNERIYESDLTEEEWKNLEPILVRKKRRGPKSRVSLRQVINGIFYLLRTGCQWRYIPREYGNWGMIYGYFQRWTKQNIWQTINDYLRSKLRQLANKEESPSVAIIDSQSMKTTQKGGLEVMMLVKRLREEKDI